MIPKFEHVVDELVARFSCDDFAVFVRCRLFFGAAPGKGLCGGRCHGTLYVEPVLVYKKRGVSKWNPLADVFDI